MSPETTVRPLRVPMKCPACGADVVMAVLPVLGTNGEVPVAEVHLRNAALERENLRLRTMLRRLMDILKERA